MTIKAIDLPIGTVISLQKDSNTLSQGSFRKVSLTGQAWTNGRPKGYLKPEDVIDLTNQEMDLYKYNVIEVPEGYKIDDFDQELKLLSVIREMPTERFDKLIKLLEGGTL